MEDKEAQKERSWTDSNEDSAVLITDCNLWKLFTGFDKGEAFPMVCGKLGGALNTSDGC
ncbi:hypothetical protein TorRG33x02_130220 [Trema orientale]|uniref:Uncharacterized protein n=1 Tax=Trema orientale TaxID=63057 RepID=A0A2P5F090_TREOI|nr:hypothetical protein TorRG33x02_130220 [Trema orientale]